MRKKLLTLILLLPILIGGCVSDEQEDDKLSPLIGVWESISDDIMNFQLEFKKNGTGIWSGSYDSGPEDALRFTWSSTETILHIKYENGNTEAHEYKIEGNHLYYYNIIYVKK